MLVFLVNLPTLRPIRITWPGSHSIARLNPQKDASVMSNLSLILPDGNTLEIEQGQPYAEAVRQISEGLLRNALAVTIDGINHPLDEPATAGGSMHIITKNSDEGLETLRHSTAHLLAWAVQDLFPGVKFAFGPAIEGGFYYDFDRDVPFTPEELTKIEKHMLELAKNKEGIKRETVSHDEARAMFKDQPYKLAQIEDLKGEELSIYRMGGFTDLLGDLFDIGQINFIPIKRCSNCNQRDFGVNYSLV